MPSRVDRLLSPFQSFVRSESAGGLLLIASAGLAFAWANSPWAASYLTLQQTPFGLRMGGWGLEKPLILWVNDLLMALFFLFVGLEIKRELLVGELSEPSARSLPLAAALGGMIVPAGVYVALNLGGAGINGWGVPMATDIAFALGMLALLGSRAPLTLKVFLTALAIIDDLGAVLVIAVFYTSRVDLLALGLSLGFWVVAVAYNLRGGRNLGVYSAIGVLMWYFMLKSGVHATIAGILLAFAVPMKRLVDPRDLHLHLARMFKRDELDHHEAELHHLEQIVDEAQSPLHQLEHGLQPWVAFAIMPIFAFFNAGFTLDEGASMVAPVTLGVFLGLLVGKPLGIGLFSFVAVRLGWARLPPGINWGAIVGAGLLAGIGFTMSLFIAALAFAEPALEEQAKLGILTASVAAAVGGLALLAATLPKSPKAKP